MVDRTTSIRTKILSILRVASILTRRAGVTGRTLWSATFLLVALEVWPAAAQKTYDTGASDSEIKVGNFVPYSGPASAYGVIGKAEDAYFRMVNDKGGINGRKVTFISYDDGYSPPKAVEQTRKLVEGDEVLLMFGSMGTSSNTAVQKYLNSKKVPQLFVVSGAAKWNEPKKAPWTIGLVPSYETEGRIYAKYIVANVPNAKISVLYQNDDFGKDVLKGLRDGLGESAGSAIVAIESYEVSEPTIDSHVVKLRSSGSDVFINIASPKFAAQAIKKIAELDWRPSQFLSYVSSSVGGVIKPAGFANAQGIISSAYAKDVSDPVWSQDQALSDYRAFLSKYLPGADPTDSLLLTGYMHAEALEQVLRQCGDDLTRQNVMKQAANLKGVTLPGMLPGITIDTSPDDYAAIEKLQLIKFSGTSWSRFGEVLDAGVVR